jgi:hypothetical protein
MRVLEPVCQGCGQPIWGNCLSALGATWHPEHFCCAGCHRPLGDTQFHLHNGAPFHSQCYSRLIAQHCAYCGKALMGKYLIDHWGTQYCPEHQRQYPSCAFCGRLVPDQPRSSGEVSCSVCRLSAVETITEARPLFSLVKRWISNQSLSYHNLPLTLELCDQRRLAELLNNRGQTHSRGATTSSTYTQDGRVLSTQINGIAVLQGLPAVLFQGVTTHELGHVWLIVHAVQNLPGWAEEGFCEYLSHRYYVDLNTPEGRYHAICIEENPDPVYGEGFRRVRSLANTLGFSRFLEILRTTKKFP